jgi:tetratricopeptide (TPR) repeat protein
MALREHSGYGSVRALEKGYQYLPQGGSGKDVRGNRGELPEAEDHVQKPPNPLKEAQRLSERGEIDAAWPIVDRALKEDPDNVPALIIATQINFKAKKNVIAYQFARRAAELAPKNPYVWGNLGQLEDAFYRFAEAERCYERGISVSRNDDQKGFIYLNYAGLLVNKGEWDEAVKMARKALVYRPDKPKAKGNLGLALLARGEWKEAWPLYDAIIGFDQSRRKMQYMEEGEWDGSPGKLIVVYEEQGLGDGISFASMLPDVMADCRVIIECDYKLHGIFRRSFPEAIAVYGTRWDEAAGWLKDHPFDASISMGALGKFYRPTPESCPGTPYLVPDSERVRMWKALFSTEKRPVIGIAWSGGAEWTGAINRRWTLEELLPVFRSIDAVWVSLQYKDAAEEIAAFKAKHPEVDLRQYAYGTLTRDYDDTAALVAALDMVFAIQTAVIHLAGAIGKECWCFVNKYAQWRYGPNDKTTIPWYRSVRLWRNVNGWPLEHAAAELRERYARIDLAA